jgi:hypothetical protein
MPFKKGQSENPKGRPRGALNKASTAAQERRNNDVGINYYP